jgi:hypothetical protein
MGDPVMLCTSLTHAACRARIRFLQTRVSKNLGWLQAVQLHCVSFKTRSIQHAELLPERTAARSGCKGLNAERHHCTNLIPPPLLAPSSIYAHKNNDKFRSISVPTSSGHDVMSAILLPPPLPTPFLISSSYFPPPFSSSGDVAVCTSGGCTPHFLPVCTVAHIPKRTAEKSSVTVLDSQQQQQQQPPSWTSSSSGSHLGAKLHGGPGGAAGAQVLPLGAPGIMPKHCCKHHQTPRRENI